MAATTKTALVTVSNRFSLIWADGLKGLVMTVLGSVLTVIYQALTTSPVTFNWPQIGVVGATAGVGYLIKNFFSNTVTLAAPGTPPTASNPPSITSATK
jgi:hypothetical protein